VSSIVVVEYQEFI